MGDKLTHKELLTFTNLTNLEWEFADLKPIEKKDKNGNTTYIYHKLHSRLTPKVFVEEDKEGKFENYVYMKDVEERDKIDAKDEEEGFAQLRRNAGIAMEYSEKIGTDNKEGDF